jgi:hypothetical protein
MEEKLKTFIEKKLDSAYTYAGTTKEVLNIRAQAFGAFMFCKEYNLVDNTEEMDRYWDEMWLHFHRMAKERSIG